MIRKKENLLEKLEQIAQDDHWKMGFSDVMYSETSFSGEHHLIKTAVYTVHCVTVPWELGHIEIRHICKFKT